MQLTAKQKRILRWVGFPVLAIVTFVFAVHLTFPYDRVKDRLVTAMSDKYDVTIKDVSPTFLPGGLVLEGIALRSRPKPGASEEEAAKATGVYIDRVELDLGLWAAIRQRVDLDITAEIGGGTIEGSIESSETELKADFSTESLPLQEIPGFDSAIGLPMKGGLDAQIAVTLQENRWDKADGEITLTCRNCTIGDGVAKIKPRIPEGKRGRRGAIFAADGLTVPELHLGDKMVGKIVIESGKATIEDFTAKSTDGELLVTASMQFAQEFKNSRILSGCMRFKLSDDLKKREPKFGNVPEFMRMAPQPDGYSNLKLQGKLVAMRWRPSQKCDAGAAPGGARGKRERPTISATKPTTPRAIQPGATPGTEVEGDEGEGDQTDDPTPVEGDVKMPAPGSSGPDLAKSMRDAARRATDDVQADDDENGTPLRLRSSGDPNPADEGNRDRGEDERAGDRGDRGDRDDPDEFDRRDGDDDDDDDHEFEDEPPPAPDDDYEE